MFVMQFRDAAEVVTYVTGKTRSTFYRELYGLRPEDPALRIESKEQWESLPFLTKTDLLAKSLTERSFIPLSEIDHLRVSSGTSGKGVLFSPRTHVRDMDYRLTYHNFENAFMAFTTPMMPHWHELFQKEHGHLPRVIAFDPANPSASVRLAQAAGVDGISVFIFHVTAIGEEMKRLDFAHQIRLLEVTGEMCTRAQFEYMRDTFPNATIVQSYNSSEVEDAHIGIPCRPITGEEPLAVYHPKHTHYLELIDPETGTVVEPRTGAEGDLAITAYPSEPSAFPLIRFRIGDTVRVVEEKCPHDTWSFTVLGRTEMDFLKIPGGVLRADEIERVLRTMPDEVSDRFEIHCSEKASANGPLLSPLLLVELRKSVNLSVLAARIAQAVRVSAQMTYADGVAQGRYAAIVCEGFQPSLSAKTKRILHS